MDARRLALFAIMCLAGALCIQYAKFPWLEDNHPVVENPADVSAGISFEREPSKTRGNDANDGEYTGRPTEEQHELAVIHAPFTGAGVRERAKLYYGITDSQAIAIAKVASDVRAKITDEILGHLEEVEDENGAQKVLLYKGSAEFFESVKSELFNQLSQIVDPVFAEKALTALQLDQRFFNGGLHDIVFYINPDVSKINNEVTSIRYERIMPDGSVVEMWEGSAEDARVGMLIDFGDALRE